MVGSWGKSEVGSAPSSNLVRHWGKTCGQKVGQPGLKTGAPTLTTVWSEDGADRS